MTNTTTALQALLDQTAIADCVRRWAFYRDGHHWAKLRDLYAADGRMTTTWTIAGRIDKPRHGGGLVELKGQCRNQRDEIVVEADAKLLVRDV